MSKFCIKGENRLGGELSVQGAKNSCLPILAACVLCKGEIVIHNCPFLTDVQAAIKILENLDCKCTRIGNTLIINSGDACSCEIPTDLMREMRSSIVFLGAVIGRCGEAILSFPGGCELGARPIDLHISSLEKMGVTIQEKNGNLYCYASKINGTYINLIFPSVGATENIILAAVLAKGTTIIDNAAREPEIVDLANFLNACGAKISGAGESTIIIQGVLSLGSCEYTVMGDRIVAITYMSAVAGIGGNVTLRNCPERGLKTVISLFEDSGCKVVHSKGDLTLVAPQKLKSIKRILTMPYPGFPTDAQAPIMAMLATADGVSVFVENIFESRYKHASELIRMGAKIDIEGKVAIVRGVGKLHSATVEAKELRGGAALVVAGLKAEGESIVENVEFIDRGYENFEINLKNLGADIERIL